MELSAISCQLSAFDFRLPALKVLGFRKKGEVANKLIFGAFKLFIFLADSL
jgi:hypothetical protein